MALGFVGAVVIITQNASLSSESVVLIQKNGHKQASWIHFVNNILSDENSGALHMTSKTTKLADAPAVIFFTACITDASRQFEVL